MEHGGSEKDALLNSNNGHVQDKSNMEPVAGDTVEGLLKDKSKKKGFAKTFSFGTTNWENSIAFKAGDVEKGTRRDSTDIHEGSPLIKDKTDIVGASNFKTFINIVKSFVGTGILFMGSAFHNGGILFSCFLLAFLAALTLICMLLLVSCWEKNKVSFGEIAEAAFGTKGKIFVDTTLVVAQLSFGCVYMVFVGENIVELINLSGAKWELWQGILLLVPFLTPLVWIRRVYKLSIVNFAATMCILFGLIYITYFSIASIVDNGIQTHHKIVNTDNPQNVLLFIGTAVFTFEGIGTVIPIQQSMKEKHNFRKLLSLSILVILIALIGFAILNYLAFGYNIQGPITLNLRNPDGSIPVMGSVVIAIYSVAVFCSYPLIVFPAVEILQKLIWSPDLPVTRARTWKKNLFRFALVCLTAGIAIGGGDDFESFVSLIGGFACTPLGLVFPPLFHYKLVAESKKDKIIDIVLMVIGTAIGIFATGFAIFSWIESAQAEHPEPSPTTPAAFLHRFF